MGWEGVLAWDDIHGCGQLKDLCGSSSMEFSCICVRVQFLIVEMLAKILDVGECWTWVDAIILN